MTNLVAKNQKLIVSTPDNIVYYRARRVLDRVNYYTIAHGHPSFTSYEIAEDIKETDVLYFFVDGSGDPVRYQHSRYVDGQIKERRRKFSWEERGYMSVKRLDQLPIKWNGPDVYWNQVGWEK